MACRWILGSEREMSLLANLQTPSQPTCRGRAGCSEHLNLPVRYAVHLQNGFRCQPPRSRRCKAVCPNSRAGSGGAIPAGDPEKDLSSSKVSLWEKLRCLLENSTDALPYAVVGAAALAVFWPASFDWFTTQMYAPGLGFLMFAVGVNLDISAFTEVFQKPQHIVVGTVAQWFIKPVLGVLTAATLVPFMALPPSVGTGIIVVSCVSGAQLSNYATFLVHAEQAPLSIVLTALSTLLGAVATPALILFLLGRRVPVNFQQMVLSITQVVVAPIATGLLCNRYAALLVRRAKPFVVFASLIDTCACVGASLSSNTKAARSIIGLQVLIPVLVFHTAAFVVGYAFAKKTVARESEPLARCFALETGMQSSLLALLLATKFFKDPLIALPCGLSVIVMTLSGFALVVHWKSKDRKLASVL